MYSSLDKIAVEGLINRIRARFPQVEVRTDGEELQVVYPPAGVWLGAYTGNWDINDVYDFEEEVITCLGIGMYGGEYFDPGLDVEEPEENLFAGA